MMGSNKNISKRVEDILSTATPKQKAILVTKEWEEKEILEKKTLLTKEEAKAIRDSIQTDNDRKEYNKYIHYFNAYNQLTPFVGLVFKEYQTQAENLLGYIRVLEAYDQEENHLNTIFQDLKDNGGEKAASIFKKSLNSISFTYANIKIAEDGYIEIDTSEVYNLIKDSVDNLIYFYEAAKAVVIATDEFIKKTHSKELVTEKISEAIADIKSDYALRVAPKYSRKNLKEKIDRGCYVTEEEKKRAVFPFYEEINPDEKLLQAMKDRIKQIEIYAD